MYILNKLFEIKHIRIKLVKKITSYMLIIIRVIIVHICIGTTAFNLFSHFSIHTFVEFTNDNSIFKNNYTYITIINVNRFNFVIRCFHYV